MVPVNKELLTGTVPVNNFIHMGKDKLCSVNKIVLKMQR